jgi:predicted PurR-regulated permease PerM
MKAERHSIAPALLQRGGRHLWEIPAARDVILILGAALALWSLYVLREIFLPVLLAALLAQLCNPVITFLELRWSWPRTVTISLILITGFGILAALILWLGPLLSDQVTALVSNLPGYVRSLADQFGFDLGAVSQPVDGALKQAQANPREFLGDLFRTTGHALGWVAALVGIATYATLLLILIPLYFLCSPGISTPVAGFWECFSRFPSRRASRFYSWRPCCRGSSVGRRNINAPVWLDPRRNTGSTVERRRS